LIFRESYRS